METGRRYNAEKLKRAVEGTTDDPANKGWPVHLKDIHPEKGMHCVDCHFKQDNHGDGKIYGEVRNAIEIDCVDCHGTISKRADPTSRDARISAQLIRMQAGRQTAPDTVSEDDVAAAARAGIGCSTIADWIRAKTASLRTRMVGCFNARR